MLRRIALAVSVTAGCAFALTPAPSAFAEAGPGGSTTPGASGNTITVTVTGTGVSGGSAGSGGTTTVAVTPPCRYIQGFTGKEYYDYIKGGGPLGRDTEGNPFEPNPGYEQYKDDTKGHWYGGMCSSADYDGDLDEFFDFSDGWFESHKAVYVPENQNPPVPPVPVGLLRKVAFDALTVPAPEIDWNPKHNGDLGTLVNIDTWVWLKDRDLADRKPNLYVRASVNSMEGEISAQVNADLQTMTVTGPNGESTVCEKGGVKYVAGAAGGCTIRFQKASPGNGTSPVTVDTAWNTTWLANGVLQGPTTEQLDPAPATTNIRILEVQAVTR
jgi:hypothetical protein